jgi:hypothetical protein
VNSGNTRKDVEAYVRQNGIAWPLIVDTNRSFESLSNVGEISLQNIHQLRVLTADGRWVPGNWGEFEDTASRFAQDAKWKVEPKNIPPALRPAWQAVEFGNYAAAAALIKKNLSAPKPDLKNAAKELHQVVQDLIAAQIEAAKKAADNGDRWEAYKEFSELAVKFKGFDIPAEATKAARELAADKLVRDQLRAAKSLDGAKAALSSNTNGSEKRARAMLEKLIKEFPDTEAAMEAISLLTRVESK